MKKNWTIKPPKSLAGKLPEVTILASSTLEAARLGVQVYFETFGFRGVDPFTLDVKEQDNTVLPAGLEELILRDWNTAKPIVEALDPKAKDLLVEPVLGLIRKKRVTQAEAQGVAGLMKSLHVNISAIEHGWDNPKAPIQHGAYGMHIWNRCASESLETASLLHKYVAKYFLTILSQTRVGKQLPHLKEFVNGSPNKIQLQEHHLRNGYANPPTVNDIRSDAVSMKSIMHADVIEIRVGDVIHTIKDRFGPSPSLRQA